MNIFKKGFTLIELLISMGLMSILLVVLGNILLSVLDVRMESESTSIVEIDGRYILARLMHDAAKADSIVSPTLGQTDDNLVLSIGGTDHNYEVNNSTLEISDNTGSYNLTSTGTILSNFSVTQVGNITGRNTLKVNFTLTNQNEIRNYSTTVGLR